MDSFYHACIGELFEIQPINCCVLNVKIITSRCLRKRPGHSSVGVTVLAHWVPGTDAARSSRDLGNDAYTRLDNDYDMRS